MRLKNSWGSREGFHPMLAAQKIVQDLGDGVGDDAHCKYQGAHKPGRVCPDRQPIPGAQRLRNYLTCQTTHTRLLKTCEYRLQVFQGTSSTSGADKSGVHIDESAVYLVGLGRLGAILM